MTQTTIILSLAGLILIIINAKKTGRHYEGLKSGLKQLINATPLIIGAFLLAGIIEVLIPGEFVQNWLSKEAGIRGVVLGSLGGMLLAIGPYAFFPVVSSIWATGAGLGTLVSLIAGWCLLNLSRMSYEAAFFGVKFFVFKLIFSIPFSLAAGFIAYFLEAALL
ncbi:MAG: permease [Bacillota bacterium]|jgi:uncharacterized membrane protein YraQ (UPF0718 family)|nr:permease [Bacillota bacterium]NLL59694.1 hypothetical protein [Tissierellia bacterium]